MKKLKILVVNGFSSGMMIVEEAKRLGYECYHLSTAMEGVPESYIKHNMAEGYDGILERKDDFDEQVKLCRAYGFDIVMPGTESGVILAEKLADALGLSCNDMKLALERRDKYYMQKRPEDMGIPCIRSALVKSPKEAVEWYHSNHLDKVVMKPRMDAGCIGFHLCSSEAEISQRDAEVNSAVNTAVSNTTRKIYFSLVQDGDLTIDRAAQKSGMTTDQFRQQMEEYNRTHSSQEQTTQTV